MRKCTLYTTFLFSISLFFNPATTFASPQENEDTILWARTHFPPGYILKGVGKDTGYSDLLDKFMIKHLKEFKHKRVTYPNFARLISEMDTSKNKTVCSSAFFYELPNNRQHIQGKRLLSAPNFVFFLHDVIVKTSKRHLYKDVVSLKELLNKQNLTFGYSRLTGPKTGNIIGDYAGANGKFESMSPSERLTLLRKKNNINVRVAEDIVRGPLRMLRHGRIDYILEYAFMVDYASKNLGFDGEFVAIPIKETKDDIFSSSYGCSDTKAGRRVIKSMNKILIEKRKSPEYKALLKWLLPKGEERLKSYWSEYEKILSLRS